jgi:hypothetical protein
MDPTFSPPLGGFDIVVAQALSRMLFGLWVGGDWHPLPSRAVDEQYLQFSGSCKRSVPSQGVDALTVI